MNVRKDWSANAQLVAKTVEREKFDFVIGDETYDIIVEMASNPRFKKFPFVMIYDFIGVDSVTHNPLEMIATYITNRIWANAMKAKPKLAERSLFIGESDDVPDREFGFLLPNRRKLATESVDFVGYVLSFNPSAYRDKAKVREFLGYGEEPLIICSIGGTSAGKDLLELCAQAYSLMKKELTNLRMVLVCGPLLPADSINAPEGVEVRGYVPELYKHLAAADLCIVTGGGTITLELTALQKPFLYFPLGKYFEQQVDVANRCERHGAGVKMDYSKTTPEMLAKVALANIGKEVNYVPVRIDGAKNAALLISQALWA
jgi:UDP:flavonoid glycosyltransferase YjiC (YdhE family)